MRNNQQKSEWLLENNSEFISKSINIELCWNWGSITRNNRQKSEQLLENQSKINLKFNKRQIKLKLWFNYEK